VITTKRFITFFFITVLAISTSEAFAERPPEVARAGKSGNTLEKVIIGEAEYVALPEINEVFKARIDTGAKTTSIYAVQVEDFQRDGKHWVRFVIQHPEAEKTYPLEMAVARFAEIKKRGEEGFTQRAAVSMDLVMGDIRRTVKVNLADRKAFEYPLLIGRDFLRGVAVVDVSKSYTQATPGAPTASGKK
jgi:hypothetical protein